MRQWAATVLSVAALAIAALTGPTPASESSSVSHRSQLMEAHEVEHRTLIARADTFADAARPRAHHGSAVTLRYGPPRQARAYVKFAVPTTKRRITNAALVLTASTGSRRRTDLFRTSSRWHEHGLTWRNAPAPGTPLGSARRVHARGRLVFDVTSVITGEGSYAFVVTGAARAAAFSTDATRHGPRLRLTLAPSPPPGTTAAWQPRFPVRGAFYYPWFPEAWQQEGFDPFTRFSPALGYYDSRSRHVISTHISEMRYAGLEVGIASWWGPGERTDARVPALLAGAAGRRFRWTLYYEREGTSDPSPRTIAEDLAYIDHRYAHDRSYLRVEGRPVVFVYADPDDGCDMARRWRTANATAGFHVVLKDFDGYLRCPAQPASWHQYAPAQPTEISATSFTVSPGFWRPDESGPRLARDRARFASDLATMVASRKRWQLVTTWNEWGEGTAVEAAADWATSTGHGWYVDALHSALARPASSRPRAVGKARRSNLIHLDDPATASAAGSARSLVRPPGRRHTGAGRLEQDPLPLTIYQGVERTAGSR